MNTKSMIAALVLIATISAASAQTVPPNLIHYQGRLTSGTGTPITTAQTLYFGIYVGGSAGSANSGTLKFQEHSTITPDSSGVFEYLVGSGTRDSGTLNPNDFNTTNSLFLQVSVGTPTIASNVLLPRTRFTSVGYSFVANNAVGDITPKTVSIKGYGLVINSSGQWVGAPIAAGGGANVTSITDTTGGDTVSGDLIRLSGSGLSNANVFVSGRQARVKSSSASQIVFAVPAGLPIGKNQVSVTTGTLQTARTVGSINLTRYLMMVSLQDDRIIFMNPSTLTVTGVISGLNFNDPATDNNAVRHIQVDFADDGALMLVPNNANGTVFAIDLTKNPIGNSSLVQTLQVSALQRTAAVAVRPTLTLTSFNGDQGNAAVADPVGNMIKIIRITQFFPPFSNSVLANIDNINALHPQVPTGQGINSPRTLRYVSDRVLYAGFNTGQIQAYQNRFNQDLTRYEWFNDNNVTGFSSYVSTGISNYQMDLLPERDRVMTLTGGSQNLQAFWTGNWFTSDSPGGTNTAGGNVFFFSMANNGRIVSASPNEDLLRMMKLTDDNSIVLTGIYHRPAARLIVNNEAFRRVAIEPVEGELAVGYVNDLDTNQSRESLIFYRVYGGVLDRVDQGDPVFDPNSNKLDIDGRFQLWSNGTANNQVDTVGAMQFLP